MNKRLHIIIILTLLTVLTVRGQESATRQIYYQAESEYDVGRIEQALTILQDNIKKFSGNMQQSAYRLMALCWLGLDNNEKAEEWTRNLLSQDPYYTASSQDPQRFIDMVENIKLGLTAKITTASSQAETLDEVPVPTTLITEDMIRNCGGQNLQEVLAAYVPGMNIVDCNDDINIAMRGIYSNGQEKILIMLNGHRLNSYCTNIAAPDFSISMEKIKQIEVLRGPASSLYGGVALTAVVNIITKQGADVDGVKIKAGIGNYGQKRLDMLFGKHYFDLDVLIWGSIYGNSGETMPAPPEMANDDYGIPYPTVTVGRVGNKPSFDFGVQMKFKDLQLLYDTHFSEIIAPYSMSTLAKSYNHDNYTKINGFSPSYASKSHHADLSYRRRLGNVNLKGVFTYDNSELTHYQVIADFPFPELGGIYGADEPLNSYFNQPGLFRFISGDEQNLGVQLKGDFNYINTDTHKGSLSFGAEYSSFSLDAVRYTLGNNYNRMIEENTLIPEKGAGTENSYNAYLQLKHQWRSFIFNAGLRYDHKKRTDGITLDEYSPRVALILLQPTWNLKLSYSRSFVDAPYLYRKTNELLPLLINNSPYQQYESFFTPLDPEFVNSFQITFAGKQWVKGLTLELNGFYNDAKNLIKTNIIQHVNEGKNKTVGLEFTANYRTRKFTADLNLTWTHTFESNILLKDINDNNNTPDIMSNIVIGWQLTPHLKIHSHILFEGRQRTYNYDLVELIKYKQKIDNLKYDDLTEDDYDKIINETYTSLDKVIMNKLIPSRVIFNIGAEYQLGNITFGFNVRNLFNTYYYRSGMNTNVVPQKGCWFMFDVAYKF